MDLLVFMDIHMDEWLVAIFLALGIARLTLIIVRDDITIPIRQFVFKHSPTEAVEVNGRFDKNPEFDETKPVSETNRPTLWTTDLVRAGWWGQVFSCPDCAGVYVAAGTLLGYYLLPTVTLYVMLVLAASMVTSLIARQY